MHSAERERQLCSNTDIHEDTRVCVRHVRFGVCACVCVLYNLHARMCIEGRGERECAPEGERVREREREKCARFSVRQHSVYVQSGREVFI